METKKILTVFACCLMVAGIWATDSSSADVPGVSGPGIELRAGDFGMLSPRAFWPSCGCPDIAQTKTFRSERLGYVDSPEFAAAVGAVANGASEFSPAEIPPDWRIAAENWIEYARKTSDRESHRISSTAAFQLRGGEEMQFPKGKDACNPDLLHLASLEYRKMQRREDLTPVSPRVVEAATRDLEELVAAKRQMARRFAARAAAIGSRIAEAERMGAGTCAPGEVARAKKELEQAFIEARMVHSTVAETASLFDRAERIAVFLLEQRQVASSRGGICREGS
jgi:hypothetical protein